MDITGRPKSVLVSLSESVNIIREVFREFTAEQIKYGKIEGTSLLRSNPLDYNAGPYIVQLIKEIFNVDKEYEYDSQSILPSTQILMLDGLDRKTAENVALLVFKSTTDMLSTMIPGIKFGDLEGYQIDFCGPYDALISFPIDHGPEIEITEADDGWLP